MSKNKKHNKLREKGITLIALVITIIVLLILAGVALSALTGDSGILNNAEKAKEKTGIANEKEIIGLAASAAKFKTKNSEITIQNMQEALDELVKSEKAIAIDNSDTIVVMFEKSERAYSIDKNGNIEIFTPYFDTIPGYLTQNSDGEYMIESIEDLVAFSAKINYGFEGYKDNNIEIPGFPQYSSPTVILMCDLDFKSPLSYGNSETTAYNGYLGVEDESVPLIEALTNIEKYKGFIPIGVEPGDGDKRFTGTFDGKNHIIKNLCENTDSYAGLFGRTACATIKNISITGCINSTGIAGAIVGDVFANDKGNKASVINCINYAQVSGFRRESCRRNNRTMSEVTVLRV